MFLANNLKLADEITLMLTEAGNVRDHRAGTIDHPFQKTRKSGFACITLLSTV